MLQGMPDTGFPHPRLLVLHFGSPSCNQPLQSPLKALPEPSTSAHLSQLCSPSPPFVMGALKHGKPQAHPAFLLHLLPALIPKHQATLSNLQETLETLTAALQARTNTAPL